MKLARLLALLWAATGWQAFAQWDTSGNGMLNGTYYFREVIYGVGYNTGGLSDAAALYGTITFNGSGTYTSIATCWITRAGSGSVRVWRV